MAGGKWLENDENGFPVKIVTSQPERGVQLVAPGGVEDEVAKAHVKAAEEAIKAAKDDAAAAPKKTAKDDSTTAVKSSDVTGTK